VEGFGLSAEQLPLQESHPMHLGSWRFGAFMISVDRALIAFAAAGLLSACSSASPAALPGTQTNDFSPQTKTTDLLYVAASLPSGNTVVMATYPQNQIVGKITKFQGEPYALCIGKAGDVFVTQIGGEAVGGYIYGYHHGSLDPFVRLNDPGTPYGCSVDPTNGNLAVANYLAPGLHHNAGDVVIYTKAHGAPKSYHAKGIGSILSCSYDSHGDLVADGGVTSASGAGVFLLRHGGRRLDFVPLDKPVDKLGPIQWDGKDFALGYSGPHGLYRITVSSGKATVVRSLRLKYATGYNLYEQFWVQGSTVIAIEGLKYGTGGDTLGFWKYPEGGKPTKYLKGFDGNVFMTGVAVSLATQ
jgi:hypothetical protein